MSGGLGSMFGYIQIFFAIIIGMYFLNLLRGQQGSKTAVVKESKKEMEKLNAMRKIHLTEIAHRFYRRQKIFNRVFLCPLIAIHKLGRACCKGRNQLFLFQFIACRTMGKSMLKNFIGCRFFPAELLPA